uniref:Uncharacterized protein n=1 Tax=Cajanus cajan TaxID=3821 RepID=A0A151SXY7_CAJCA|nr:hypothetical protein KK1_015114 [Cajanus cajan]
MKNFEFLLGMNIWYDIFFAVNSVSKIMRSKDMHIDVAIDHLRDLITYLKNYRENGFASSLESTKSRINYFLYILNQSSIESRLEYKNMFDFLFDSNKFKTLGEDELKKVVTVKRNFSKLKLIKSYLRSTMLQDTLNELAILSIESEMLELLNYKTLINNFETQKTKKIT